MFPDQKINVFAEEANFFVLVLTSTCLLLFLHSSNIMQENQWKVFFFQWGHLIVLRWVKYLHPPLPPHPHPYCLLFKSLLLTLKPWLLQTKRITLYLLSFSVCLFFSVFLLVFLFVRENFRPMKTESSYFIPVKFSWFVLSGDKETKTSRKHHSRTTDYHDKWKENFHRAALFL